MKPRKHAELIKAWADGAEIERHIPLTTSWAQESNPLWLEDYNYRIKPEPKPDMRLTYSVEVWRKEGMLTFARYDEKLQNVTFVVDWETGELKSAEVLK